jgi:transcriptional regulator with XRE-family HTH domain
MTTQIKLRRLMEARGLNPEALAVAMQEAGHDVSVHTVLGWYYGRREPRGAGLRALADTLAVTVDELLGDLEVA